MNKRSGRAAVQAALALVLSILCGVLIYHRMGFIYAIADDVIMRDIASGAFTGTPDGHLVFIKYALGALLSGFYRLIPTVDWYGFFLVGVIFFGLFLVLYRGFSRQEGNRWKLVYAGISIGLFGSVMLFHVAQFEWTISAAMLGACVLYFYGTADREAPRGQKIFEGILVWLACVLTFSIRSDVFFMVLPGLGVAFLWKFVRRQRGILRFSLKELLVPGAVFLTVGLVILVEAGACKGEEWAEFQRFQTARSQVYDYSGVPSYEANPSLFQELGLDENEVRNLRHYALYLVDGMDADMMEVLSEEAKAQNAARTGPGGRMKNGVILAAAQLTDLEYLPLSLFALLFLAGGAVLALRYKKKALIPLVLFVCLQGTLWLGLGFVGRLPERVSFSMHLVTLLGAASFVLRLWPEAGGKEAGGKLPGWQMLVAGTGLVICLGTSAFQWRFSCEANLKKRAMDENYQLFKEACKEEPEKLFFIETYMAEPVGGAEVTAHGNFDLNNCLTLGDWYSTSPIDRERFAALGIEQAEKTIKENPKAYLVVRDMPEPGFLKSYFEVKYPGTQLACAEEKVIQGRTYYFYQVQSGLQ